MSEQRALLLRKTLIGSGLLFALVLLAGFYSVVSGAVNRAAHQRFTAVASRPPPAVAAVQRNGVRGSALLARVGN